MTHQHSGSHNKKSSKLKSVFYKNIKIWGVITAVLLIVIICTAAFYIIRFTQQNSSQSEDRQILEKQVKTFNKSNLENADTYLDRKKYGNYQSTMLDTYYNYMLVEDYASAEKIIKEIRTNVPADQRNLELYAAFSDVYEKQGNAVEYKKYTNQLIEKLKSSGRAEQAAYYEQKLKEI